LAHPKLDDADDFGTGRFQTDKNNKNKPFCEKLPGILYRLTYFNFPIVFLSVCFISELSMTSSYTTDLIKVIYLGFLISFVVRYNKLLTKNRIELKSFRLFNMIVLLTNLCYQLPFFPC